MQSFLNQFTDSIADEKEHKEMEEKYKVNASYMSLSVLFKLKINFPYMLKKIFYNDVTVSLY